MFTLIYRYALNHRKWLGLFRKGPQQTKNLRNKNQRNNDGGQVGDDDVWCNLHYAVLGFVHFAFASIIMIILGYVIIITDAEIRRNQTWLNIMTNSTQCTNS